MTLDRSIKLIAYVCPCDWSKPPRSYEKPNSRKSKRTNNFKKEKKIRIILHPSHKQEEHNMAKSPFPIILLVLCFFQFDRSEASSIPPKFDGFAYGGSGSWKDSILIEAFFDPLCSDSRDSWPPLKKAVDQFSPRVSLIVHPFPLP